RGQDVRDGLAHPVILRKFGPHTLAEAVAFHAPAVGERRDDGQPSAVHLLRPSLARCGNVWRAAVGHAYLDDASAYTPRGAYHTPREWPGVADRVADQLGDDGDDIGQQRRGDHSVQLGREPVTCLLSSASMMRHHHAPGSFSYGHRHAHASP